MKPRPRRQTENSHPEVKLEIRRRICRLIGGPLRVLDCCAAAGLLWEKLGREFDLAAYLPIDLKPQIPGTLRMDSRQGLRALDLAAFNVIDVDTFGEPWDHWLAIVDRLGGPTAVFLTFGCVSVGGGVVSMTARTAMGLPTSWRIPHSPDIAKKSASYLLPRGCVKNTIHKAVRWTSARVDYYGLWMEPKKQAKAARKRPKRKGKR